MAQQIYIVFFYVFSKKMGGNLNSQNIVFQFDRDNRFKPSVETGRLNVIPNDTQTVIPDNFVRRRRHILIWGLCIQKWLKKMVKKKGKTLVFFKKTIRP
jgi:hypothetical protein